MCFPATKKNSGGRLISSGLFKIGGDSMLPIAIIAVAAGLVLGLRFSLITLALLILATTIIFAIGVWGGGSPLVVALQLLATLLLPYRSVISLAACLLHIFPREGRHPPTARKCDICMVDPRER